MTALWVCIVILFLLTIIQGAVSFMLWVFCYGVAKVWKNHKDDKQAHWSSKWEDSADA